MRTCQSCGLENPPDRDFCECGEYLRWEPTGYVQAVTPEMAQAAAEQAAPAASPTPPEAEPAAPSPPASSSGSAPPAPPARVTEVPTPAAPAGNGHGNGNGSALTSEDPVAKSSRAPAAPPAAPASQTPKTAVQRAVTPPPAAAAPQAEPERDLATISLRLADRDADKENTLQLPVEPGDRTRVLALVRNQSGIVDNYTLGVDGLPADWWSVYPDTVYLVPFGTGGTYEQEVEIHIHPPRNPEAEAKLWPLKIVAISKAHTTTAATAAMALEIRPYVETGTKVRPERAKGRRKANYDVAVENKANAPVLVALEGQDTDDELQFGFNRPPQEIPPGHTVNTQMQVRPAKQLWIGRAIEKRFTVATLTGEEAEERLAAEPVPADVVAGQGGGEPGKRGLFGRVKSGNLPGAYGPRVYKPQVNAPGINVGSGGLNIRKPSFQAPKVQAPQVKPMQFDANSLKTKLPGGKGGGGSPAAPTAPLLPSQGIFRQKAWLPWWLIPILLLLVLLAVLLYLLLPKNVAVPNVVRAKSAFDAEKKLVEAGLKLNPVQKTQVTKNAPPGSVLSQTPKAGEKAKKGELVSVLLAVGTGNIAVPKITGMTLADAEKTLRAKGLTLGQSSPQPPDPKGIISSQIPSEKEIVKQGTPVDVFFPDPNGKAKGKGKKGAAGAAAGAGAAGAGGGGGGSGGGGAGGGGAGSIVIPAIAGAKLDAYAKGLGDLGLVPVKKPVFNAAPVGTLFATSPPGGSKANAGDKVQLFVSGGFPELAFNDDKNVLLVNGATGKKLAPIAKSPSLEKHPTWSPDGTHVAYIGGGRVFLKDMTKADAPSLPLTANGETFTDPTWAPTTDLNLLALTHLKGTDTDLCLGQITKNGLTPRCISEPKFDVGKAIHWSPNGKEILAFGVKTLGTFGMVRWRSSKPFSPDPKDWGHGSFVTDISKNNEGVLDAALSPDGKRLAEISNQGGGPFQLYLGKPNDYLLTSAKSTTVQACKLAWRGDSQELVVVQGDAACSQNVGSLVRLPVSDPRQQRQLNAQGDNPAFQPLTLGG